MAKIIEVILTYEKRGDGTPENRKREVMQLWTKEGQLICEKDPIAEPESTELRLN